jgi:hypothetical protein
MTRNTIVFKDVNTEVFMVADGSDPGAKILIELKQTIEEMSASSPANPSKFHVLPIEWGRIRKATESKEARWFQSFARLIDLILEPDSAESAIANLDEAYRRRLATHPGHAKRWLIAQVVWIVYGRATELLGTFSAARAGK